MRKAFFGWNDYVLTQSNNKAKALRLADKTTAQVHSKYFKEWLVLYQYYSSFTKSDYCYTQKKHSELHFLKKWLDKLKTYHKIRKAHNANKVKADTLFFQKYVKYCY